MCRRHKLRSLYFSSILQERQYTKKEWHRLWEIYESDKYVLFDVPQNSFSALPRPDVQVIDGRTIPSPCPLLELFMLCFPSQMQIYLYNSDDFDSLGAAIKERRIISAMAVFFEVWYHQAWRVGWMSFTKRKKQKPFFPHHIVIKIRFWF